MQTINMISTRNMISAIVPVYNVEQYLDRCIESIINQTYQDIEIIIIDDGSTDRCPLLCDIWAKKDKRIKVIHKPNGGLSDARNAGLMTAVGEYIAFIDSDDWIAPEMFETLVSVLNEDKSDIAACAVALVSDNEKSRLLTVKTRCVLDQSEAQEALLDETLLKQPVWYKLYRHDLIRDITFEVGKMHEDVFWSYQVIGRADRVSLVDYVGYYYRQHSESIMGKRYSINRLDAIEAVERRYKYLAEKNPELEKKARMSVLSSCIYHGQMALKYLPLKEQKEVFQYLEAVKKQYDFPRSTYSGMKVTHRLWFDIARLSLLLVARIKNLLNVGI